MRPYMIMFVLEVSPDHMTGQVTAYLRNHVTFSQSHAYRDLVRSPGFVTVNV
jgi:hypothetical protein